MSNLEKLMEEMQLCNKMLWDLSINDPERFSDRAAKLVEAAKNEPPQGSAEWLALRGKKITGSEITDYFGQSYKVEKGGEDPVAVCVNKILEKCGRSARFAGNVMTSHGNKYEPCVDHIFEKLTGKHVEPAAFIGHEIFPFLGASPDGYIVEDGHLVEIKCPYGKIYDKVPNYYYHQIQLQLEVCRLPGCHFIAVKFRDDQPRPDWNIGGKVFPNKDILKPDEFYTAPEGTMRGIIALYTYGPDVDLYAYKYSDKIWTSPLEKTDPELLAEKENLLSGPNPIPRKYGGNKMPVDKILVEKKIIHWVVDSYLHKFIERDPTWLDQYMPFFVGAWEEILYLEEFDSDFPTDDLKEELINNVTQIFNKQKKI